MCTSLSQSSLEKNASSEIYSSEYVQRLFDEMSHTYGIVNVLSSFGFAVRWRSQCIDQARVEVGDRVCDLMSGMGEMWPGLARQLRGRGKIVGIDFSRSMVEKSQRTLARITRQNAEQPITIEALLDDALASKVPDQSVDVVTCSFGLKTLDENQRGRLAREVHRILKPGGRCSFVEISVPPQRWLRAAYFFYLNQVVPIIGWLLLGNPENYRMLGRYTSAFGNCDRFVQACRSAGLDVEPASYFFGCATGVVGTRPQ